MSTTVRSPPLNLNAGKMSFTETYFLAQTARVKLLSEASREEFNLRRLVCHANFLDTLTLELAAAKREHEIWLNKFVCPVSKPTKQRHIQWADTIVEDPEEDLQPEEADSSDPSGSDSDHCSDEEIKKEIEPAISFLHLDTSSNGAEEFEDDREEDYYSLALHLTQSHGTSSPTEVLSSFSKKKQQQQTATSGLSPKATTSSSMTAGEQQDSYDADYILPQRFASSLISAISVY